MKAGALEFRDIMADVIWLRPCRQWPGGRTMKASSRIDRTPPLLRWSGTRSPIQNAWNGGGRISPNLIGLRADLLEHVEVVLVTRPPHSLEDADIPARNVRHAQAEYRFKPVRTHQRCIPRVRRAPVMPHEDRAGDLQRVKQTNQVPGRLQRGVQVCVRGSCAAPIAPHVRSDCSISGRRGGFHLPAPRVGRIRKPVAEKDGWPFPLLSYGQGHAIRRDVVRLRPASPASSPSAI